MNRQALVYCAALALLGCPRQTTAPEPAAAAANELLALDAALPFDPGVRRGQLDNGLTWYIEPNAEPPNRAELRLVVQAGSVLEDDDQRGLAHYVEHMGFNGSTHFEGTELVRFLESVGVSFGADLNAYTSLDETVYKLHVPTDTAGLLDKGLLVLRDWADGLTFDPDELEKERGVVLEEWRTGRSAWARRSDASFPVLLRGTAYADRMVIGTEESLEGFDPAAAVRFYREWYRPELMAVIVAGDVDADSVQAQIEERFGDMVPPTTGRERGWQEAPVQAGTQVVRFADPELSDTNVSITSLVPERQGETVAAYRAFIGHALVGRMLNERFETLRTQPDAAMLWGGLWRSRFTREIVLDTLQGGVIEGRGLVALEQLLTECERARRFGFLPAELERAKRTLLASWEQAERTEDTSLSADVVEELIRHFLHGEPAPGISLEADIMRRHMPDIALEEVNGMVAAMLGPNDRTVQISGPGSVDDLPSEADLLAVIERVAAAELSPPVEAADVGPLMTELPEPGQVAHERVAAELGVTEWTLSNGVHVIFKATDFAEEEVQISAFADGGWYGLPIEQRVSAMLATDIAAESGLGPFDALELERWRAGRLVSSYAWAGGARAGVEASGTSRPEDLEAAFQLLHQRLTAPRFDEAAFERIRRDEAEWQRNRLVDPGEQFSDAMTARLWSEHPWEAPGTLEDVDRMDLAESKAAYEALFADFGRATVVVVGDVEASVLLPIVLRYVGSLGAGGAVEPKDVGRRQAEGEQVVGLAAGSEPRASVQLMYPVAYDGSMADWHALDTMASGLDVLLREDLREDRGGTYGAGVWIEYENRPVPLARVMVNFDCDPERVPELLEATRAQVELLRTEPLSEEIVSGLAEQQRRQEEDELRDNGWWGWALGHAFTREGGTAAISGWLGAHERVTAEFVLSTAQRIDPKHRIEGVRRPEE